MSKLYRNQDVYNVLNALVKQTIGASGPAVNAVTFCDIGKQITALPEDAVINGLSDVVGMTEIGVKNYDAKFNLIQDEGVEFASDITRKISYYSDSAIQSKFDNFATASDPAINIGQGLYPTMEEEYGQNLPHVVELVYTRKNSWSFKITFLYEQLVGAFASEAEFMKFWNGHIASEANDQTAIKEAYNRETALEFIAGTALTDGSTVQGDGGLVPNGDGARYVARTGSRVKLITLFNELYNSSYDPVNHPYEPTYFLTWDDIKKDKDKLTKFQTLFVTEVKRVSDQMSNRTNYFHVNPYGVKSAAGTATETKKDLPRWTPKANQRMFLLAPFYREAEAIVMPSIFNPKYLDIQNAELVEFWQSIESPYAMNVKAQKLVTTVGSTGEPALTNTAGTLNVGAGRITTVTPGVGGAADTTSYSYSGDGVLAVIFDKDAVRTGFKFEKATTTPQLGSREYRNTHYHYCKVSKIDQTENAVVFTLD